MISKRIISMQMVMHKIFQKKVLRIDLEGKNNIIKKSEEWINTKREITKNSFFPKKLKIQTKKGLKHIIKGKANQAIEVDSKRAKEVKERRENWKEWKILMMEINLIQLRACKVTKRNVNMVEKAKTNLKVISLMMKDNKLSKLLILKIMMQEKQLSLGQRQLNKSSEI